MTPRFILARSCAEPDREFDTLFGLARAIDQVRCAAPGQPGLKLRRSIVARGPELPGGAAVSVRLKDGEDAGHGALIGYAFLPGAVTHPVQALLAALEAVSQRAAA